MAAPPRGDVALAIGQQVEQMIYQAKMHSEARVRHDISAARSQLQRMDGLIAELGDRVARCVRAGGPAAGAGSQMVDRAFLSQKISQLQQKWGSEVKALKQDLHRTILAHNHNSDLLRHHRDALSEARRRLDAQQPPRAAQVDQQIERVERMLLAGQAKQRTLDALAEHLLALEGQVGQMLPPYPGAGAGAAAAAPVLSARRADEPPTQEEVRIRLLQAAARNNPDTGFNASAPVFEPGGAGSGEAPAADDVPADEGDDGEEEEKDEQAGGGGEEEDTAAAEGAGDGDEAAEVLSPAMVSVPVRLLSGGEISVDVETSDSVAELLSKVEEELGVDGLLEDVELRVGGELLSQDTLVAALVAQDDSQAVDVQAVVTRSEAKAAEVLRDGRFNCCNVDVNLLAKALEINTSLQSLSLCGVMFEDAGAQALARALESNTSLTQLSLDFNNIQEDGAKALAKGLESNTSLTWLCLWANDIPAAGIQALRKAWAGRSEYLLLDAASDSDGSDILWA